MKYSEARPLINSGSLIAFSDGGLIGGTVRRFTASSYSHVGFALRFRPERGPERLALVESRAGKGVTFRPLSDAGSFYLIKHKGEWSAEAFQFAWARTGTNSYDIASIIRAAFNKKANRDEKYICSELAGEIMQRMKLLVSSVSFGNPQRLVEAVMDDGGVMTKVVPDTELDQKLALIAREVEAELAASTVPSITQED